MTEPRLPVWRAALAMCAMGGGAHASEPHAMVAAEVYARAEQLLPSNIDKLAYDNDVGPTWIPGSDLLWFKTTDETGVRFMLADPARRTVRPAFDMSRMNAALRRALHLPEATAAPSISEISYPGGPAGSIRLVAGGKTLDCDQEAVACAESPIVAHDPRTTYDASGQHGIVFKGPDLGVRDVTTGAERTLTTDGEPHKAYGAAAEGFGYVSLRRWGIPVPPTGDFSPDGSRFATYQLDESRVPEMDILQYVPEDGAVRPKLWRYREALHGDAPAAGAIVILELATGRVVRVLHPPSPVSINTPLAFDKTAWSADSRTFYFVDYSRDERSRALYRTDAASGETTALITESSATGQVSFVNPGFKVLGDGRIVWPSDRDGYEQLYLYSRSGQLIRKLTPGAWPVREIIRIDERAGTVFYTASGKHPDQDPYLRHLYSVSLRGGPPRELTPKNADHEIATPIRGYFIRTAATYGGFSPSGRYFADAYSRVDLPTVTVICDADGREVMQLATARLTKAGEAVYRAPEPFKARAADGATPLYGVLIKPRDFDPAKRYPVIDAEYDSPQTIASPKRYLWDVLSVHSGHYLAELGFVVVNLDARGKPLRSRAFWEYGYGALGRAGVPDRVSVLNQLGAAHPYMDMNRVGVFGYSGGGFAAVHAIMDQPDVYKVAVAISPYTLMFQDWNWGQAWQGPYDAAADLAQEPWTNAANLRGKLLLMVGDVDDVVHPASVMRIADALIKNNKDFDMLVVPNGDHQMAITPYVEKRVWDYFVRNLLGAEPPADYRIGASQVR